MKKTTLIISTIREDNGKMLGGFQLLTGVQNIIAGSEDPANNCLGGSCSNNCSHANCGNCVAGCGAS
jgi:hypothetical protein